NIHGFRQRFVNGVQKYNLFINPATNFYKYLMLLRTGFDPLAADILPKRLVQKKNEHFHSEYAHRFLPPATGFLPLRPSKDWRNFQGSRTFGFRVLCSSYQFSE